MAQNEPTPDIVEVCLDGQFVKVRGGAERRADRNPFPLTSATSAALEGGAVHWCSGGGRHAMARRMPKACSRVMEKFPRVFVEVLDVLAVVSAGRQVAEKFAQWQRLNVIAWSR